MKLFPSPARVPYDVLGPEVAERLRGFAQRAEDVNTPEGRAVGRIYMSFRADSAPLAIWIFSGPVLLGLGKGLVQGDWPVVSVGLGFVGLFALLQARSRALAPLCPHSRADLVAIALPFLELRADEAARVERLVASSGHTAT